MKKRSNRLARLTRSGGLVVVAGLVVLVAASRLVGGHIGAATGEMGGAAKGRIVDSYGKLPMAFEANHGQAGGSAEFVSRGIGYTVLLEAGHARVRVETGDPSPSGSVISMDLVGASQSPVAAGEDTLPGVVNYFIGNDPARWRANIPTFERVRYRSVYPGIDLVYYGNRGRLEYDFLVSAGADPRLIRLRFDGARSMSLGTDGTLVVKLSGGELRQQAPVVYQMDEGVRRPVRGGYALRGADEVAFEVGDYDPARELVIDPVLVYSTYLGGSVFEGATGIAVDAAGNAHVTGRVGSLDFPLVNPVDASLGGGTDAFVTKFDPAGGVVFSTFLGSDRTPTFGFGGHDEAYGIALDAAGHSYIVGWSNGANFPVTANAIHTTCHGIVALGELSCTRDVVVAKLDAGGALVYSTYLGTLANESASAIAVDAAGLIYIGGHIGVCTSFGGGPPSLATCLSEDELPTTPNAYQPVRPLPPSTIFDSDAFVAVLDSTMPGLAGVVYATYLAGHVPAVPGDPAAGEQVAGIGVDASGQVYVTGSTSSSDFPSKNAFQPAHGGGTNGLDGFVARLDPGQPLGPDTLQWSTFFGGFSSENANAIAVDAAGSSYITGLTFSQFLDFPTTPGAYKEINDFTGGGGEAFVAKFDASGDLVYSTLLGGGDDTEIGLGIAVDGDGNAHVAGTTQADDTPTVNPIQAAFGGGFRDAFVSKLNASGSDLLFSTYLGGIGNEQAFGVGVDALGHIYVVGETSSLDFPTVNAFQPALQASQNAFVTRINPSLVEDFDGDGIPDGEDTDDDNDGQFDEDEIACGSDPRDAASTSPDNDGDGAPDCVDSDDDNDGVPDLVDNCAMTANLDQADQDGDGVGDACDPDDDNDQVPDALDHCPNSDTRPTVVIDGIDSGVTNIRFDDGCTLADLIAALAENASNHGDFVSAVAQLLNGLKMDGVLTGAEKGAIQSAAARARIP
jgi:hypothetical protein